MVFDEASTDDDTADHGELDAVLSQNAQLREALASRLTIGQAQGILMERLDIDADQAFEFMKRASGDLNIKLRVIAADIVRTRAYRRCRRRRTEHTRQTHALSSADECVRVAQRSKMLTVETRIDLDAAAQLIEVRRDVWRDAGIAVGQTTWRDEADGWPWELKTSRSEVRTPDSVGVALRKGEQEGSVVLFRGGWADLLYWDGESERVVDEAPGWEDWLTFDAFADVLDRLGRFFK